MATNKAEPTWEQLLGVEDWQGLLDPLDLSLLRLILLCGDLCQVTYDAFNSDTNSPFCGSSRFGKSSIFPRVKFAAPELFDGSAAAAFLYATSRLSAPEAFLLHPRSPLPDAWDRQSNWMGYVAVSSSATRRVIYVAWRGTIRDYEWINVLGASAEPATPILKDDDGGEAQIMRGWLTIYTSDNLISPFVKASASKQLRCAVKKAAKGLEPGQSLSIVIAGHSLGGSLAVVSAFDLVENSIVPANTPVTAVVFGCPMVGNEAFRRRAESHRNLKILHTRNVIDLITRYPGRIFGYVEMGTELVIDSRKSPELKASPSPSDWHNLQGMLHVLAGWNGHDEPFAMRVQRSLALVNRSSGFLKESNLVPESWWVIENKGMVLDESTGNWALAPPNYEDLPEPPQLSDDE